MLKVLTKWTNFATIVMVLLLGSISNAQETELMFQERTNKETERRLLRFEAGIDLTSMITGILPLANGGTGKNLTDPNADKFLFWDDSESGVSFLTVGTGLTITGTTLDNTQTQYVNKISTTTFTGGTNSGDITLTAGRRYKAYIRLTALSANSTIYIRFNSDSTGTRYAWNVREVPWSTTPSETMTGDDSDSEIESGGNHAAHGYSAEVYFDNSDVGNIVHVYGFVNSWTTAEVKVGRSFQGYYDNNGTDCTSFEILPSSGTMTGEVILYEII